MSYAKGTDVTEDKSKGELRRLIYKYGASNYKYAEEEDAAAILFDCANRRVRFVIHFPPPDSKEFLFTEARKTRRSSEGAYAAYESERRRRWRALILAIKAKFEVVESGIATFEEEFLAYVLLPNRQTVGQTALPAVAEMYHNGKVGEIKLLGEVV